MIKFRPYVNKEIAQRLYTTFIRWAEDNDAVSFGYYVDGDPWVRIGTQLIAYSKWKEYFDKNPLTLL